RGEVIHELLAVHNHGREPGSAALELRFRSRFQDLFAVKGFVRQPPGELREPRVDRPDRVELRYRGRDGLLRATALRFSPAPARLEGGLARYQFRLDPDERFELLIEIRVAESEAEDIPELAAEEQPSPETVRSWLAHAEAGWARRTPKLSSANPLVDRVL